MNYNWLSGIIVILKFSILDLVVKDSHISCWDLALCIHLNKRISIYTSLFKYLCFLHSFSQGKHTFHI